MLAELGKFLVVGGACFVLDTALANVFHFAVGLGPTTSKALSTVIAVAASYVGNRLWSFAHRIDQESPTHGRDATAYLVINAVGLVITLVPVDVIHYVLHHTGGVAFNLGSVIGTGMATVFRFWSYRRFVFIGDREQAELQALV
ncbi:MAG: GtrA family protein [Actinomycetota bacterium]|nr:GtrA family protein [Actinomycetota bacterium]